MCGWEIQSLSWLNPKGNEMATNGKIKIYHVRVFDDTNNFALQAKGGATVALREYSAGNYHFGVSYCSLKDNFCRKTGRLVALKDFANVPGYVEYDWNKELDYRDNISNLLSSILFKDITPSKNWWRRTCPDWMSLGLVQSNAIVYYDGPHTEEYDYSDYVDFVPEEDILLNDVNG